MGIRDRKQIDNTLRELSALIGATKPEQHVRLLQASHRLHGQLRGASRGCDSALSMLTDACRKLSHLSAGNSAVRGVIAAASSMLRKKPQALNEIPEFRTVGSAFATLTNMISQLPASAFETGKSERPDVSSPQRRDDNEQSQGDQNWNGIRLVSGDRVEVRATGFWQQYRTDDPIVTGEMVPVQSSNVSRAGFELNMNQPQQSTLKVEYLQNDARGGKSKVRGPMYLYRPIAPEAFRGILRASSAGGWVWDNLRVRGTVSGYQIPYSLSRVRQGVVPRRATVRGGNQWLLPRTKTRLDGRGTVRSQLGAQRLGPYRPGSTRPDGRNPARR